MKLNIKLQDGDIKKLIWRDRHRISKDIKFLYKKYIEITRLLMCKGYTIQESRGSAMMFISFPYFRTLCFVDENELLDIIRDVHKKIINYESSCN